MVSGNERRRSGLVLLSGFPGSGKTTFAQALLRALPAAHIESDAVRRELRREPRYTPAENRQVFDEVERRAAAAIASGMVAIVDATNLRDRDRGRFVSLAARGGGRLVSVRVTAPDAVIRRRLGRPRDGFSQAGVAVFEGMLGRAERFQSAAVVVDTRFPIEPALSLVARLLEESEAWTPRDR